MPEQRNPTPIGFTSIHPVLAVRDLAAAIVYYRACVERGAEITMPLADRPFGMRDFRVVDPSGNALGFGEPMAYGRLMTED